MAAEYKQADGDGYAGRAAAPLQLFLPERAAAADDVIIGNHVHCAGRD
jgi:hypothetical protein